MVNEEAGYLKGPNSNPSDNREEQKQRLADRRKTLKRRRKEAGVPDDAPDSGWGGPNHVSSDPESQYQKLNQSPKKSGSQSNTRTMTMNNSTYTTYANIAYIISEAAKSNLEEAKKPKEERLPVGKSMHGPVTISTRKTPSGSKTGQDGRTVQDVQMDADPKRPNKNAQAALKQRLKTNKNIRKHSGPHDGTPSEVATGKGNKAKRRVLAMESDVYFHLGQIIAEGRRKSKRVSNQGLSPRTGGLGGHLPTHTSWQATIGGRAGGEERQRSMRSKDLHNIQKPSDEKMIKKVKDRAASRTAPERPFVSNTINKTKDRTKRPPRTHLISRNPDVRERLRDYKAKKKEDK